MLEGEFMNVLIYENDKSDRDSLIDLLENYFKINQINYKIHVCASKEELLEFILGSDLLFLDIELNQENGIELGMQLNKIMHYCKIVIVSMYQKYLIDGYKIHASRYMLKPLERNFFFLEMDSLISEYFKNSEGFFDEKLKRGKILYHEIMYIDVYNRKTALHMINGEILYANKTLGYWKEKCKEQPFEQTHKSVIVNFDYISGIDQNDIILSNGERVPISRGFKNSFNDGYVNYLARK